MASAALDDVKRRLEINNIISRNQAFTKLLERIRARLRQNDSTNVLDFKNGNCPEVELVWERCLDLTPAVSNGMCCILVSMVASGEADPGYVLDGLLNRVSHARNGSSLIMAIKDVLVLQKTPRRFRMRNPVHPFIVVLQQNPCTWPNVLEQLKLILYDDLPWSSCKPAFLAVKPVLQHVIYDPCRPDSLSEMRVALFKILTTKCLNNSEDNCHFIDFLLVSIRFLQLESVASCTEASFRLLDILDLVLKFSTDIDYTTWMDYLLLCFSSLCSHMSRLHLDISSCLDGADRLSMRLNKSAWTTAKQCAILSFATLLLDVAPVHQLSIIGICWNLVNGHSVSNIVSGLLFLPLITILSAPSLKHRAASIDNTNLLYDSQSQAAKLIHCLESSNRPNRPCPVLRPSNNPKPIIPINRFSATNFSSDLSEAYEIISLAVCLQQTESREVVLEWLQNVRRTYLVTKIQFEWPMLCFLSSIAIHCDEDPILIELCVDLIADVAEDSVDKAVGLFPVLLYVLKIHCKIHPHICLRILNVLPRFAAHKICVTPIIKLFLHLGKTAEFEAVSVRLMCSLWQRQDRAYPHLNSILVDIPERGSQSEMLNEVILAKVASISDVCRLKSSLYGADLLALLSKLVVLDDSEHFGASVTALAIDSIRTLCEHEIIDLRTTWLFLKRVIGNNERPLVVEKLCKLLSLAESLMVDNADGEIFVTEVVERLWYYATESTVPSVKACAYESLCHFSSFLHRVEYLPREVKEKVDLSTVEDYVPGSCYLDLLMTIDSPDVLTPQFEKFFMKLVATEVEELPRSLLLKAKMINKRPSKIPKEKKNLPCFDKARALFSEQSLSECPSGLKNSLAFGLLFAFEPLNVELGRDGNPTNLFYLKCGSTYCKVMEALLLQTQLDTADWRRTLLYVKAWSCFIERTYFAMVQARLIQLDLHMEREAVTDEDSQMMTESAWLWARDKMAANLKDASRGRPAVHGNAIVGLAGLAAAVVKYDNNSEKSTTVSSNYMSHTHWLHEVTRAFVRVLSPSDEPAGGPFTWCYSISGQNNPNQAYTALSFVLLAEHLVVQVTDFSKEIVNLFLEKLIQPRIMPMTKFSLGLGLGLFLHGLVSHNFMGIGGASAKELVSRSAGMFKDWCFSSDLDSRHGGLLGLATLSATLAQDDDIQLQEFAHVTVRKFISTLPEESSKSVMHEILRYGAALILTSMCVTDVKHATEAKAFLTSIMNGPSAISDGYADLASFVALSSALPATIYESEVETDGLLIALSNIQTLSDETASTVRRLSALHGVHSQIFGGYEHKSIQGVQANASANMDQIICGVLEPLYNLASSSKDVTVKGMSLWMLGELLWKLIQADEVANQINYNLSFLGDKSVLKCVITFVQNFILTGQPSRCHPQLLVCLRALSQKTSRSYPTINWSSLLKPVLHCSPDVEELCVEIAIKRSSSSQSAAAFLTSLLVGSDSQRISERSRLRLYCGLPVLLYDITATTLQIFLEDSINLIFERKCASLYAVECFVQGVSDALKVSDPPAGVFQILYICMVNAFQYLRPKDKVIWNIFCEATQEFPDEIIDRMTVTTADNCLKILSFNCSFISSFNQPITFLNSCLDVVAMFITKSEDRGQFMRILLDCFQTRMFAERKKELDSSDDVTWILQLMGHYRNVMEQRSCVVTDCEAETIKRVTLNLFIVFGAAIMIWSRSQFQYYSFVQSSENNVFKLLSNVLPASLQHLVGEEVWKPHVEKITEWMIAISKSSLVDSIVEQSAKNCLLNLRQCSDFKKSSIWTRVVELQET